jgi:hypothetical protein
MLASLSSPTHMRHLKQVLIDTHNLIVESQSLIASSRILTAKTESDQAAAVAGNLNHPSSRAMDQPIS